MKTRIYPNKFYTEGKFHEVLHYKNLLPDPKFTASGWSGGTVTTEKVHISGNSCIKVVGTTSTAEVCVSSKTSIPLDPTHIYYASMWCYQDTLSAGSVGYYWPIAEPSFRDGFPLKAAGAWQRYSHITGRSSFTAGSYQFRFDFNNSYTAGTLYISSPMLIDLTASFGEGMVPTLDWCDRNFGNFIETTKDSTWSSPMAISTSLVYAKEFVEIAMPNIIKDGSFETTSAWSNLTRDTTQALYGSASSKLPATGTVVNSQSAPVPVLNHIYYGRHSIKTDGNAAPADCRFEWYGGDGAGLNFVFGWNKGNHSSWYTESTRMQITAINATSFTIRNFVVNSGAAVYCDGLMIVDLTAFFGAGNEPSKEWCDRYLVYGDTVTASGGVIVAATKVFVAQLEEKL